MSYTSSDSTICWGLPPRKQCRKQNVPYVVEPIGMFMPIVRSVRLKRLYHYFYGREMLEGAARVIATSTRSARVLAKAEFRKKSLFCAGTA